MTLQELQRQALQLPISDRAALVQTLLESLRRENYPFKEHPLAKFAGILNDAESSELQQIVKVEFRQVDEREW
jgi:hypothetical protein